MNHNEVEVTRLFFPSNETSESVDLLDVEWEVSFTLNDVDYPFKLAEEHLTFQMISKSRSASQYLMCRSPDMSSQVPSAAL